MNLLSVVEQTLPSFYPRNKATSPEESPERTTTKRSFSNRSHSMSEQKQQNLTQSKAGVDRVKETKHVLSRGQKAPDAWQKVTFAINLPYEMVVEQIQLQLPAANTSPEQSKKSEQKKRPSEFCQNLKLLNIHTSLEPRERHNAKAGGQRLNLKSAFSEEVTEKDTIEVNSFGVTKELLLTFLCLKDEVAGVFKPISQLQSTARGSQRGGLSDRNEKGREAKRLIAELEGFHDSKDDEMDELDQEVAFISKMHQETATNKRR